MNPDSRPSANTFELDRHSRSQWWQISQFFKLIPKKEPDPFLNTTLRSIAMFLVMCPIHVVFMLYIALQKPVNQTQQLSLLHLVLLAGVVWLIQGWLLLRAGHNHARIVHSVVPVEGGLKFQAPFFTKHIHWFEITDIFPLGTIENNFKFYQVDCNNGEYFLLSDRLSNCNELVELIDGKISGVVRENFEENLRVPDALFDGAIIASSAILIAVGFSVFQKPVFPSIQQLIVFAAVYLCVHLFIRFHNAKIPQIIRVGEPGLYLRSRTQSKFFHWDAIQQIKSVGPFRLLKTRTDWFVLFLSKREPVAQRLLERTEKLLTKQHRIIS
jgi:hypothetical protein